MNKDNMNNNAAKGKNKRWLVVLLAVVILLISAIAAWGRFADNRETASGEAASDAQTATETLSAENETQAVLASLRDGLEVLSIGKYTGVYVEDGSDELLSGILMLKVVNHGEEAIQYAEITVTIGEETAKFTLSTLKPGAAMVVLEQSRMAYDPNVDYESCDISCDTLALFREPMSMHGDKLKIQILDGAINVINISGGDIPGDIAIYYKNIADDVYYGGITYVIRLEGGLKADEIRQLMASHFSDTNSEIMFVTIAE